jgi:serine/threonine protein kinase
MLLWGAAVSDLPERPPSTDPLIGLFLNEYEVLEAIAEGGMGVVYRGVHPVIKKRVAIKVLKPGTETEGGTVEQLAAEAEAVNSIRHRNIVDIFGIGRVPDGRPYIIMEYLEGRALDAWLAHREQRVPLEQQVKLLADICVPLAAAHRAQVIHRDLKPSNVFLCDQADGGYFLKLLDFGMAKRSARLDGVTEQTKRAFVMGTPDFMAPEQAKGKGVSPRTDLYALGCIGYLLATGKLPYTAATPFDVMVAHVRAPVPHAAALSPGLPPALDALLHRLMAKRPDARPRSADEVREELGRILEALPSTTGADQPRMASSGSGSPTRRWVVRAAALALVGLAAVGLWRVRERPAPLPEPGDVPTVPLAVPLQLGDPSPDAAALLPPPADPLPALPDADEELAPLPTGLHSPVPVPRRTEARVPSAGELKRRLQDLEVHLRRRTPRGEAPDPAALQFLAKYRVQVTMAESAPDRAKLARELDQWERLFLGR